MSIMLSVYTRNAFEEVLLPAVDNTNFSIRLDRERYELREDAEVCLEVVDGAWKVLKSPDYDVFSQSGGEWNGTLQTGEILHLRMKCGTTVTVAAIAAGDELEPMTKYSLSGIAEITIGKAEDNLIAVNGLGLVSAHHARISRTPEGWLLEDISTNGTYVDGERLSASRLLRFGDCINIFGTRIVFLGVVLAINDRQGSVRVRTDVLRRALVQTVKPVGMPTRKENTFRRSLRNLPSVCEEALEIEGPPALQASESRPLLLTIGPSFTMAIPMLLGCLLAIYGRGTSSGGLFMYTGVVTAVTSAMLGVMWALVNLRYAKKKEEERKELRFKAYSDYLLQITDYLKEKQAMNAAILREAYPCARECAAFSDQEPRLWNRNYNHDDFLLTRMGVGDIPFQMKLQVPPKRFSLVNDFMAEKPRMMQEQYKILRNVPIGVDLLKNQLVGIVGSRRDAFDILRCMAVQIAANHCYTEVKMAFVGSSVGLRKDEGWDFARWLPHVWSEDRKSRYFARTAQESREVLYELSRVFRARAEQDGRGVPKPYYIIFVDDASILENEPMSKYILEPRPEYGLTTVFLSGTQGGLPNACQYIVQKDSELSGVYSVADLLEKRQTLQFDTLTYEEAERFARAIAGVRVNELESGGDIPNVLDFLDMMGVDSPEELDVAGRWKKNRTYESLRALVGKKAGNADCYLDIHEKYHGPHGLVAGTTGSGKSETLQTYILSLATNFSPRDVGFLLIDFKGGGMANLFADLPHTLGRISNLSGSQIRRAMVSIKSENQRRQRIFNEYGVNHIDGYTKLFKNNEVTEPIPHLLIIIDEFAEMKREEPEFMRELISVAQVGRSLGVHLILATQKPGGTVDDSIRSNTKFRLCLRVQDRQDSAEMLHRPDAAYITQAGRCYIQVGNDEIYDLFQSGWSGAGYDEEQRRSRSVSARMIDAGGRAAMAGSRSEMLRKEHRKLEWAGILTDYIEKAAREAGVDISTPVPAAEQRTVAEIAAEHLATAGVSFMDSGRNRLQLQKMVALWPESDEGDRAECILQRMEMLGQKLPERKERTQLEAVIDHLRQVADREQCNSRLSLWLPPLPEHLPLQTVAGDSVGRTGQWIGESGEWGLETVVGLYDAPENQLQMPLSVDFAENGHHAICGVVNCGKSTFLQTMLYGMINRYSPEHLNIYALDFGGGKMGVFRDAPHVGGVLDGSDITHIQKFFRMIERMVEERQKLFAGANYSQYVKAHGKTLPAVLIVIDNYAAFREKTDNAFDAAVLRLSGVGVNCGIYLAVTAGGFGTAEIPNRLAENFRTAISLEMGDKFKYGEVLRTMHFATLPEANIKGRGLVNLGGNILEFQTALPLDAEDDYQLSEAIEERCRALGEVWGERRRAKAIPVIPEKPNWEEFSALDDFRAMLSDDRSLPLGYLEEDASVYGVDLSATFCYLVSGKARTGRTSALRLLMESASMKGGRIVVIDKAGGELKRAAQRLNATYIENRKELFDFMCQLHKEFPDRNKRKRAMVEQDFSEEEIFTSMTDEKLFIFIHDIGSFMEDVNAPADEKAGIGSMKGFVENVMEKGKLHQVYFFAGMDADKGSQYTCYSAFNTFCGYRTGMLLGGEIDRQRIFNFENVPFAERARTTQPGIAMAASTKKTNHADKVILPQWKG